MLTLWPNAGLHTHPIARSVPTLLIALLIDDQPDRRRLRANVERASLPPDPVPDLIERKAVALCEFDQVSGKRVEQPFFDPIDSRLNARREMLFPEGSESSGQNWRFIGCGLAVDPELTAPTDMTERLIATNNCTAVRVSVEVLGRFPIGERPRPKKRRDKARIFRAMDGDGGLIPVKSGGFCQHL